MRLSPIISLLLLWSLPFSPGAARAEGLDQFLPLVILSPLPDSSIEADQPLEISLLLEGTAGLELRIFLDSLDITPQAEVTEEYLFYLSPAPPSPGRHSLKILLLRQPDTVIAHHWSFSVPAPKAVSLPSGPSLELTVDGGIYFSHCSRDTAWLGLASPAGWHPLGSSYLSAGLWSGRLFSHLSFDPAYDRSPHGLAQFQRDIWELSLGEFYPDFSPLAFSGPSTFGMMATRRSGILGVQGATGRTQKADTLFQIYEQYLYGGQVDLGPWHSLSISSGFLYGWDRPGSLPDSVRFPTSTFIYDDTLTGLVDTMTTLDTLPSGSNSLWWLGGEYSPGKWRCRAAAAWSGFRPDLNGSYLSDRSFLVGLGRQAGRHFMDIRYLSWGKHYKSFGNPYLEAAKNELLWSLNSRWSSVSSQTDGSLYRVFTDSANGNSFRAGGAINLAFPDRPSINVRADYYYRPYRWYLFTSRSLSLGASGRAEPWSWQSSLGLSSNSGVSGSQSCNARLALSRRMMRDRLLVQASTAYYWTGWDSGLSSQDRISAELTLGLQVSDQTDLRLALQHLTQWDRVDSLKDYHQQTAVLSLSRRW
jgi:hypothetical protein